MLLRRGWGSSPLGAPLPEVPCIRCEERVAGLGWGELCGQCTAERKRRASFWSQRISLPAAALMAVWVFWRLPADPTSRVYGGIAILAVYVIVRRIVHHVAMQFLPR